MLVRPLLCFWAATAASAMRLRHADPPKAPARLRAPPTCAQQAAAEADAAEMAIGKYLANASNVDKRGAAMESMNTMVGSLQQVVGLYPRNDTRYQGVTDDMRAVLQLDIAHRKPMVTQEQFKAMSTNLSKLSSLARKASSMHLNDLLQSAANETNQSTAHDFLRTLRLCATCNDFMRVGPPFDGGYIMCADGLANSGLGGAYSYGIESRDGWGMDVASIFGVPLYEYDCFTTRPPIPCGGCQVRFFPECIQGNNEHKAGYGTLTTHMERNGDAVAADGTLLLKLDVEGAEWDVLAQESASTLRKFRHINVELHSIYRAIYNPVALQAMQNLLAAGFSVVHLHGNNGPRIHPLVVTIGQYSVPNYLEVTLVRSWSSGTACPNYAPQHIPEDRPCMPERSDLPVPVLPP